MVAFSSRLRPATLLTLALPMLTLAVPMLTLAVPMVATGAGWVGRRLGFPDASPKLGTTAADRTACPPGANEVAVPYRSTFRL